jgi:cellobiose phosphorylase
VTYHITVTREGHGKQVALRVNGKAIEGTVVPAPVEGQREVRVEATLK